MVGQRSSVPTQTVVIRWFFENRYGGYDDYMGAIESVWGGAEPFRLEQAVAEAQVSAEFALGGFALHSSPRGQEAGQLALLLGMPEPDFRLAVEIALRNLDYLAETAERITTICRNRGIPWRLDPNEGFEWIGDQTIEREVMVPALTILNDPRFGPGAGTEFAQARAELKLGTPEARKQVLQEAACAVESAMKVLLQQRGSRTTLGPPPRSSSSTSVTAALSPPTPSAWCSRVQPRGTSAPVTAPGPLPMTSSSTKPRRCSPLPPPRSRSSASSFRRNRPSVRGSARSAHGVRQAAAPWGSWRSPFVKSITAMIRSTAGPR